MEARVVGQSGFDKLEGEYLFIADLWIHEDYQYEWSIFRELMSDVLRRAWSSKWIYFQRQKYGGRQSKNYSRSQIMRLLSKSPMAVIREAF